jgi:hypothetical protein
MASPAELRGRITRQSGAALTAFPGYMAFVSDEARAHHEAAVDEARKLTEAQVPQQPDIHRHTVQPRTWPLGDTFKRK